MSVFIDKAGNPSWNLSAETVVYPLDIKQNGKTFAVYFELKQPNSTALKAALQKANPSQKVTGKEITAQPGDLAQARELIMELFVRMYGVSVNDPKQHKAYLEAKPNLQERLFLEGLVGVQDAPTTEDSEGEATEADELFSITIPDEAVIGMAQAMYSPVKESEYMLQLGHKMHTPSADNYLEMKKLYRMCANPQERKIYSITDLSLVESLYRKLVISLEGYTLNGEPCEADNKADWISAVPLAHKYMAIQFLFEDTEVKN